MSKKNTKKNKTIQNLKNEMMNTMDILYKKKLLYFYNDVKIEKRGDIDVITWHNHVGGRANCGKSFTTLNQYEHILEHGSYTCLMFDGSILRSSFEFKSNQLVGHSHLWWPSPFGYNCKINPDEAPLDMYENFICDDKWYDNINMRTPIRIDYQPDDASERHPAIHMHTQHHECRMRVSEPLCFNKFIKYIFDNFYSHLDIELSELEMFKLNYDKKIVSSYMNGTSMNL
ncbi:DUF2290 domain-containing protein [Intestinibacter bartlettii]|uniref:DUF2290 domain-containing protein n=1 Tax=Intestinibacter bartlettii TaxID=261299 RepID=UPI00351FEB8D